MKESGEFREFTAERGGGRIDSWLAALLPDLSRSRIGRLIASEHVWVNGKGIKPSHKVTAGELIRVLVPEPEADTALPEAIPLDIVFEDKWLVAVNKPAGLVVHPAPGHPSGTLVNALLNRIGDLSGVGGVLRPGIVHRLDKETSGILLVAKDDATHRALAQLFKTRGLKKTYLAVALGKMTGEGTIDSPIGRHPKERKKMAAGVDHGRAAVTRWKALKALDGATLLEVVIETGRTHQIRVHLASIGHPVAGDQLYGGAKPRGGSAKGKAALSRLTGQALHAWRLELIHPVTGEPLHLEATAPKALSDLAGGVDGL